MSGCYNIECKNGKWRLVVFLSKSLNETERTYKIHDKEMLAVIRGLENWRHLFEDKIQVWDLERSQVLWQPLITKTNDHTNGKSLSGISSGEITRELDKESLLN